jgi:hypothetical protein
MRMSFARGLFVAIAVAVGAIGMASAANARNTSVFSDDPYPCTVLSPYPCTPSFCSVFGPQPCQPEINYPYGQGLRLTIASRATGEPDKPPPPARKSAAREKDAGRLNTISDLFAALRGCWVPPAKDVAHTGTQLSVRLSFKRNGEIIGEPRVTFVTPGTSAEVRQVYLDAVTNSLKGCTPLPFTNGLGGALAGRPIFIRFIDDRPE